MNGPRPTQISPSPENAPPGGPPPGTGLLGPSPCAAAHPWLVQPGWLPDVRAGLETMLALSREGAISADGRPPLATLDFDQTCLFGDVSETLLELVAEDSGRPLVEEYQEACRVDLRKAYIDLVTTLVGGRTEREARALALRTLEEGARRGRLGLREEMRELVWALHRHGWEVRVITASAEVLVQPLAERIGIHPNHVYGMRPPLGPDGRYGEGVLEPVPFREGKLELIRQATGRDPTFSAGDSRSDAAMMLASKFALLWDHGDPVLRGDMAARGFWIQPNAARPAPAPPAREEGA